MFCHESSSANDNSVLACPFININNLAHNARNICGSVDLCRTGHVSNFEANVWQSTSMSKASAFHSIINTAGSTVANTIATSAGASVGISGYGASVSGSADAASSTANNAAQEEKRQLKKFTESTTSTATVIECESDLRTLVAMGSVDMARG